MIIKILTQYATSCLAITLLLTPYSEAQDTTTTGASLDETNSQQVDGVGSLTASITRDALESLANLTQGEQSATNMWILVPSNLTASGSPVHESDFSLFKLNADQFFNMGNQQQQQPLQPLQPLQPQQQQQQSQSLQWQPQSAPNRLQRQHGALFSTATVAAKTDAPLQVAPLMREARKIGLFSNVMGKPKVSPLYLVNGTVCRFVNSQPICTTLSTTGLFRNPTQGFLTPQNPINQNSGFFNNPLNNNNNNNNLQQQQQQQQFPNSRQVAPPPQPMQNGFQQNGFPQQNQQVFPQQQIMPNQQFRPAALMDDEAKTLNVTNNSAATTTTASDRQKQLVQSANVARPQQQPPSYTIANRRPLNLFSLTRPFRAG